MAHLSNEVRHGENIRSVNQETLCLCQIPAQGMRHSIWSWTLWSWRFVQPFAEQMVGRALKSGHMPTKHGCEPFSNYRMAFRRMIPFVASKFKQVPHGHDGTVEKGHGRIEIRECSNRSRFKRFPILNFWTISSTVSNGSGCKLSSCCVPSGGSTASVAVPSVTISRVSRMMPEGFCKASASIGASRTVCSFEMRLP